MTNFLNVMRSEASAAILAISLNSNDQDSGEMKEIEVCQGGETLISIKLKNFMNPVKSGSLIFARGSISQGMNRTKLVVDLERENDRWVVLDSNQLERKADWSDFHGLTVKSLSDAKMDLTQSDVNGLSFRDCKKHTRCYKIVQFELTKENQHDLGSYTPNYIKGEGYIKMFQIFKVLSVLKYVLLINLRR